MNLIKVKQFSPKFKILELKKTFIGFRGGRGGGKSWAVVRWLVVRSTQYRMDIACCRAVFKKIKESAYKLVVDTIYTLGIEDQFIILENEIINKVTNARFIFLGLNHNPAGVKSLEGYHIVFVEEADQVLGDAWDKLIPTIIRKRGAKIIAVWNPNLPSDPVEKIYNPQTNPDCVVENINYTENPYIEQAFVDQALRIKETDPQRYEWEYLGAYRPVGTSTWLGIQSVLNAIGKPHSLTPPDTLIVGGLDLGFMQDRSALTIRHCLNVLHTHVWRQPRTQELVGEVVHLMQQYRVAKLGMDSLGPGVPVYDLLDDALPGRIQGIAFSQTDVSLKECINLRGESWVKIRKWLEDGGSLPTGMDNDWVADLCNIKYSYDSKGRIALETKKSMVARGLNSCDLADSLGLSLLVEDREIRPDKRSEHYRSRDDSPTDWMGI